MEFQGLVFRRYSSLHALKLKGLECADTMCHMTVTLAKGCELNDFYQPFDVRLRT